MTRIQKTLTHVLKKASKTYSMYKVNPIENEIFDHYRKKALEINKAIELLKEHNYTVIDLEGNWLQKNKTKYTD